MGDNIKKRNNFLNLIVLLFTLFLLYCFDFTIIGRYIGYRNVKKIVLKETNILPLAKMFFGDVLFTFYDSEIVVSNDIIREIDLDGNKKKVYLIDNELYSSIIGYVCTVNINENKYIIKINSMDKIIVYSYLTHSNLVLYQKIEANTLIGELSIDSIGYYYIYEEN